ncbi:MAG: DeoR/GlpR family DNA-binding transcription regulator, partial [Chloroflexota bacterium]
MPLIQEERRQKILQLIETQGSVDVSDLCTRFGVSEMTIRRDLADLQSKGLLRRVRGGAVNARGRSYEPPFLIRAMKHRAEKARIGQAAAALIGDGDSVALDVGTTTLEIARHLEGRQNLTIV